MHCKNRNISLAALMMSALLVAGCTGDTDGTPKPMQMNNNNNNNGGADAGMWPDASGNNNNGMMDSGVVNPPNTGACPENFPGCRCEPTDPTGMTEPDQATCKDSTAVCAPYSDSFAICVYRCQSDTDCAGKLVGNPDDAKSAALCRNIGDDGFGVCVETEKQDDERCRLHALAGREMMGCRSGATCTTLSDDSPGHGTCLQFCSPTPQDPTGGCTEPLSYCNPSLFQSMSGTAIGVCSDKPRGVGAKCGGGYTKQCDTGAGELFCFANEILDPSGQDPLFFTLGTDEGFCIETCDPDLPSCPGTTDPAIGPGVCKNLGTGSQGKLGLCSHECNKLTDEENLPYNMIVNKCTGTGTLNAGTNCFAMPPLTINSMEGIFGQVDLCIDVLTPTTAESAVKAEADATTMGVFVPRPKDGTTPADCVGSRENGELFSCPSGTYCSNVGTQRTPIPACVRCTTSSTVAAAPYETNECVQSTLADSGSLVCVPFGKTSTVVISGPWMGFCANAPN